MSLRFNHVRTKHVFLGLSLMAGLSLAFACTNARPLKPSLASNQKPEPGTGDNPDDGDSTPGGGEAIKQPQVGKLDEKFQSSLFLKIVKQTKTPAECKTVAKSQTGVRLLTRAEYKSRVETAFEIKPDTAALDATLPVETAVMGYGHLRDFNLLSPEKMESFITANELVAKKFIADQGEKILKCGQGDGKACVTAWLKKVIPALWTVDAQPEVLDAQVALFGKLGGDTAALQALSERLMLSPYFLFHRSLAEDGKLSSWEVADSLSDILWNAPVSGDLAKAAAANQLGTSDQISAQVKLMIKDPKFQAGVRRFVSSWLGAQELESKTFQSADAKKISAQVKTDLTREASDYLYYLIQTNADDMNGIFDSGFTIGSQATADAYGFSAEAIPANVRGGLPESLKKISLPEDMHGILGLPSQVMSRSGQEGTNVPRRGKDLLGKFMCNLLSTPENINDLVNNTKFDKNLPYIEALEAVTSGGSCASCHKIIDGIGGALETISPYGTLRAMDDHNRPATATGQFLAQDGSPVAFEGVKGLAKLLKEKEEVKVCMAVQAFRMVFARLEREEDTCTIVNAYQSASKDSFKFHQLLSAMLSEQSFLQRKKIGEK